MSRIEEIRERERKATRGPWLHNVLENGSDSITNSSNSIYSEDYGIEEWFDREFIAHARGDIPWLLTEVDRLRSRLERAETRLREIVNYEDISLHSIECIQHRTDDKPPYVKKLMIRVGHRCAAQIAQMALDDIPRPMTGDAGSGVPDIQP